MFSINSYAVTFIFTLWPVFPSSGAAALSALLGSSILEIENCHFSAPLISYSVRDSFFSRLNVIFLIFLYQVLKIWVVKEHKPILLSWNTKCMYVDISTLFFPLYKSHHICAFQVHPLIPDAPQSSVPEFSGPFIYVIFLDELFAQVHVTGTEKTLFGFPNPSFGSMGWDSEWSGSCLTYFHGSLNQG